MTSEITSSLPNPWSNSEKLSAEILAKATPVNYVDLVGSNSVLMLGENHFNSPIRNHLAAHASTLRDAGITHYAIEAPHSPALDVLNSGKKIELNSVGLGPVASQNASYEQAVQAMASQGIKVIGIDIDQSTKPTKEDREAFLTNSVMAILESDPSAKVAVLIGGFHAVRKKPTVSGSEQSMAVRLLEGGAKVVTAQFAGGTERTPTFFLDAASRAGMGASEFMMNLQPYHGNTSVVFGPGSTDYVIHLPQVEAGLQGKNSLSPMIGGSALLGNMG